MQDSNPNKLSAFEQRADGPGGPESRPAQRPGPCYLSGPMKTFPYLASILAVSWAAGCGDPSQAGAPDGGTINSTRPPFPTLAGVYECQGVWDLSGPINSQRTLGDVAADLLVEEIVDRANVPAQVRDKAEEAVRAAIAAKVKTLVDTSAPPALRPDSELMKKLGVVLASTEVRSTIELTGPPATVRGTEELRGFTFTHDGLRKSLTVDELLAGATPLVTLAADWKGKETAPGILEIEAHDFELRVGKLVLWVVQNVLGEVGGSSLAEAAAAVVDCKAIPAGLLDGKDKLTFGVGAASYGASPALLEAGCLAMAAKLKGKALGLFDLDAGVRLGGKVQYQDQSGDPRIDRLTSQAGYGGLVTKGIHPALAPRVMARFEAVRRN